MSHHHVDHDQDPGIVDFRNQAVLVPRYIKDHIRDAILSIQVRTMKSLSDLSEIGPLGVFRQVLPTIEGPDRIAKELCKNKSLVLRSDLRQIHS